MLEVYTALQKHLESLLSFWKDELELRDWSITIKPAHRGELDSMYEFAECHIFPSMQRAAIKVGMQEEFTDYTDFPNTANYEFSVVHELLEIKLDKVTGREADKEKEVLINSLTRTLLRFRRLLSPEQKKKDALHSVPPKKTLTEWGKEAGIIG